MSSESNDQVATAGQPPPVATAAQPLPPPKLSEEIVLKNLRDIKDTLLDWSSAEIQLQLPTDVLLITANDHEFIACYSYMKEVRKSFNEKPGYVYFGRFVYENNQYVKVALMKCSQGPDRAQTAVRNGTTTLRPKVTLFVGLCATVRPEKAKLGDVVISYKLETYDDKKIKADGTTLYRNIKTNVSRNMDQLISQAEFGWTPPLKDPDNSTVEVHRNAVMLSGSELVNNLKRREKLACDFPEALGLEMEGKGLYAAAYDLQIEWAVIKAVSDLADGSKDKTEDWQPFASVMAVSVVHNIFHPVVLKKWPHYRCAPDTPAPVTPVTPSHPIEQILQSIAGTTEGSIMHGGRTIQYSTSGRVHSLTEPWVYDATARDVATNFEVKKKHYETRNMAINAAIEELVKQMKERELIED